MKLFEKKIKILNKFNFIANDYYLSAQIAILCLTIGLLTSCNLKHESEISSSKKIVDINLVSIYDYNQEKIQLKIKGSLFGPEVTNLNVVNFYADSNCKINPLGTGIQSDFSSEGINLNVPLTGTTDIYVSTNTLSGCYFAYQFIPNISHPESPILTLTSPKSPTRETFTPALFGTAFPMSGHINFFKDSECQNQIGSGTNKDFSTVGIQVTLEPNTESNIYSTTTDPFQNKSNCALIGSFKHSIVGPPNPSLDSITPLSPNNYSLSPIIKGKLDSSVEKVSLFSDPGCSKELISGKASDFITNGFTLNVSPQNTVKIYALAYDASDNPSLCTYLSSYTHDSIPPEAPIFGSANPLSPTKLTYYPKIKGTASTESATIKFYNSPTCSTQIGIGDRLSLTNSGIPATVKQNDLTNIYAKSFDLAGNPSACVFFTSYIHTTLPPDPPIFGSTNPISPNNKSTTPSIIGGLGNSVVPITSVRFYSDEFCSSSLLIGSGTAEAFTSNGITLIAGENTTTTIYGQAINEADNISPCGFLTNYGHSTLPAVAPTFLMSIPSSPSKTTKNPWIIGSAPPTVSKVYLYSDASCSSEIASSSRLIFTTLGIQINVMPNSINPIYSKSYDVYGNDSPCVLLTTYTHTNISSKDPVYSKIEPFSPNKLSTTPLVYGTVPNNPLGILQASNVKFFDSVLCLSQVGSGSIAKFSTDGIPLVVPSNATITLYGKSYDDAGNSSNCTFITNYTHIDIAPGQPQFLSTVPSSPSYTEDIVIKGTIGPTTNFLEPDLLLIYTDNSCSNQIATGSPTLFTTSGVSLSAPINTTTSFYGRIKDPANNFSPCTFLTHFFHNNYGPTNIIVNQKFDGTVGLSWNLDTSGSPTPNYVVKRSLNPGGPYSILSWIVFGNSFTDTSVVNGETYYYTIASSNNTGVSNNSSEVSITVAASSPSQPINLSSVSNPDDITLSWSGTLTNFVYEIRRSEQPGGPYSLLQSNWNGINYIDKSVQINKTYYYVVYAQNPLGQSFHSNETSAKINDFPPPPTHLTAVAVNSLSYCSGNPGVILTWTPPAYYSSFKIWKGPSTSVLYQAASAVFGNSWIDCNPNLDQAPTYPFQVYYTVTSLWGTIKSSVKSNFTVVSTGYPPSMTLSNGNGYIVLSWGSSSADSFTIERSNTFDGPFSVVGSGVSGSSFVDTSVVNGQGYFYRIYGIFGGVKGYLSNIVGGIPQPNPSAANNLIVVEDSISKKPLLSWSPTNPVENYAVYRSATLNGTYTFLSFSPTPSYLDTLPLNGLNYYKVTAFWSSYETPPTNIVLFRYSKPILTANANTSNIALSWTNLSGASGYTLSRSTQSGGPYTAISNPSSTPFTDTTAVASTGYYYILSAQYPDGTSSSNSSEVSAMIQGTAPTGTIPSGLTILSTTNNSVTLSWSKVKNSTSYKIYRSLSAGGAYTLAGTTSSTTTTIASLATQTTYYFKITSIVGGVTSNDSAIISAKTINSPSAPSTLPGDKKITLQWSAISGVSSYSIQRSTDGINFTTIASGIPTTTYTDIDDPTKIPPNIILNGQIYFYQISINDNGRILTSPSSAPVTPGSSPFTPSGLSVIDNSNGTDIFLNWSTVSNATSYNVYITMTSGSYDFNNPITSTSIPYNTGVLNLTPNTKYYLVVTALTGLIESAPSTEISIITSASPPAPTISLNTSQTFNLSWSGIVGASSYTLFRSIDGGVTFDPIQDTSMTSYTDNDVITGNHYRYRYLPKDSTGTPLAMSFSSQDKSSGVIPLEPTSLYLQGIDEATVNLSWSTVPNVSSYKIYRSSNMGGPYNLLATISSTLNSYQDNPNGPSNPVAPGTSYYYVISSLNSMGTESIYSNEQGIIFGSAPLNITAQNSGNSINITWTGIPGSSGYAVKRSLSSGGPYGVIGNVSSTTLSYTDTDVDHGVNYFYIVESLFPSARISTWSSEASAVSSVHVNLEVPIELADQGLSSNDVDTIFERTRTSLNSINYDGIVTYFYEIVATNSDDVDGTAFLVDSANNPVGILTIPSHSYTPIRIRASFSPQSGLDYYRVKIAATSSIGMVQISSARIIVKQIGATRTKIYIPLMSALSGPINLDSEAPLETTSASIYSTLTSSLIFKKQSDILSKLPQFNAWEFEALASTTGQNTSVVSLYNTTKSVYLTNSESIVNSSNISMIRSRFSEGSTNFGTNENGDTYEVSMRCHSKCSTGLGRLYKAGLWVTLNSINSGQVYYRLGPGQVGVSTPTLFDSGRFLIDSTLFTNPVINFMSVASNTGMGSNTSIDLVSDANNDFGTQQILSINSSLLSFDLNEKKLLTTISPILLTPNYRYFPRITPSNGTSNYTGSMLLIKFSK